MAQVPGARAQQETEVTAAPVATLPEMVVQAERALTARQDILARFGAREITVDRETIQGLPGGASQSLSEVLLQTPGVVQDGFGDIHVRGEHRNLQYRLNGWRCPRRWAASARSSSRAPSAPSPC